MKLFNIPKCKDNVLKECKMAVIMVMIAVIVVSFCMPFVSYAASNDKETDKTSVSKTEIEGFVFDDVSEEELEKYRDILDSVIRVGYVDDLYPFCYSANGTYEGITRRMFDIVSQKYGVKFDFVRLDDKIAANKALRDGVIDIIAYYADSMENLREYGLTMTDWYVEAPLVIIKNGNPKNNLHEICATVPYLYDETVSSINIDKYAVEFFASERACLDSVADGRTMIAVCNGYLSQHLLSNDFSYNELEITTVLNTDYYVCAAVAENNKRLTELVDLILPVVSDRAVNEFAIGSITKTEFDMGYFTGKFGWIFILMSFIIVLVVVIAAHHTLRNSRRLQKLLYMDTQMNIWNLNYLRHVGAKRLLGGDTKSKHLLNTESGHKYALCCINLGKFRRINLIYGFDWGTAVLQLMVRTFRDKLDVRKDIYCRDHGDKFVLMLRYNNDEHLTRRLKDIMDDADKRIFEATYIHIPIQMGVYKFDENVEVKVALDYAMQAMGAIRDSKVSEVKYYDEALEKKIKDTHRKQRELDEKNVDEDFVTFYQAKVDIHTGKVVGAEALVRMKDPKNPGKVLPPGMFVPYYEQTGFITKIDFFVYEDVCKMLAERIAAGKPVVTISVNFSRLHFMKKDFPDRVDAIMTKYGIPKELIEVEMTETLAVEQLQDQFIQDAVDELNRREIRISIDDFGSGYSSLGIIEKIPASVIKLDRSFLINHKDRNRQIALMRGIVSMAADLDAQIVCEGVETEEDIELMKMIGATVAQGYYYSKPAPQREFISMLEG